MEKSGESEKLQMDIEGGNPNIESAEQSREADRNEAQAEVAAEVADSAQKLDGEQV